ncbi:MAG: hypothetical protein WC776_03135 [Patescibacteria group bacterium]|jgi:hypothetical protein
MSSSSFSGKGWYSILMDTFHSLMKKHDMPEDIANELESFILTVAKEQFRSGNKSGIAWTHKQYALKNAGVAA